MRKNGWNATATIPVELPRSDDYYIWARIKDGSCTIEGRNFSTTASRWTWVTSVSPVSLAAGSVDVDVNSTDYGVGIDAIYLTTDAGFTPVGKNSKDLSAPPQITGVSATANGAFKANVSWDVSSAPDLHHYNLYIGSSAGFVCDSETLVVSPAGSSYLDWQLSPSATHYYKITAVDRQGNESEPSTAAAVTTASLSIVTLDATISGGSATVNIPTAGNYVLWVKQARSSISSSRVSIVLSTILFKSPVTNCMTS